MLLIIFLVAGITTGFALIIRHKCNKKEIVPANQCRTFGNVIYEKGKNPFYALMIVCMLKVFTTGYFIGTHTMNFEIHGNFSLHSMSVNQNPHFLTSASYMRLLSSFSLFIFFTCQNSVICLISVCSY